MSRSVAVGDAIRVDGKIYRVVDIVRQGEVRKGFFSKYCTGLPVAVVRLESNSYRSQTLWKVSFGKVSRLIGRMKKENILNCG